jgi:hypothetical protein
VCAALGLSHRFPSLLMTILELTEGEFHLSPSSVLLGIRRYGQDAELKVELVCGTAMRTDGLICRLERVFQPDMIPLFRRWRAMICPDEVTLPVRVVSIKTSTVQSERLSVYAAECFSLC